MEIDIKIKLEDQDISLLIKSLFEIFKKLPKDIVDIHIDPQVVPPISVPVYPTSYPIPEPLCGGVVGDSNYPVESATITTDQDIIDNTSGRVYDSLKEAVCATEEIYYSDNGESVKKIEEKKNEEE